MVTQSNGDQQESTPSFFKVIRYPSADYLSLPNAFVRRYFNKISKNPTLVTATGEHSWRVKFVKIGEDYCFAHGWEDLVKDVGLCIRDVVVFWLIDSLTFHVTFLGANGCEKYVPVVKTNDDDGECHDDDDDDDDDDDVDVGDDDVGDDYDEDEDMQDENLCFEKVIGPTSFRYMLLPVKFVKATGLDHKEGVKLKDHEGKEWPMRITANKSMNRSASLKYSLSAGWAMFRNHHKFSEGDVCTFTFDKQTGIINLTLLFKSKRSIIQETPMEEVKGTKSCYGDGSFKIEDQWSPTEKPCSSGGGTPLKRCAEVKIKDGWVSEIRKRGDGVEANTGLGTDGVIRSKHVVYF